MMPAGITAATASPALRSSSKLAMMQRANGGLGMSFTVTSVITASMPSLPITAASRAEAGVSRAALPNSTGSPCAVKPRSLSTLCSVRPYFRQCTPPEFSATFPPIVQAVGRRCLADGQVAHAALHQRRLAVGVQIEDAIELGQGQGHPHGVGHC